MNNSEYIKRVLEITEEYDDYDAVMWRSEKNRDIIFYVICNDFFAWGTADAVELTPESLDLFEQSYIDANAAYVHGQVYGSLLFCARIRKMKPQDPYLLNIIPKEMHHLFIEAENDEFN